MQSKRVSICGFIFVSDDIYCKYYVYNAFQFFFYSWKLFLPLFYIYTYVCVNWLNGVYVYFAFRLRWSLWSVRRQNNRRYISPNSVVMVVIEGLNFFLFYFFYFFSTFFYSAFLTFHILLSLFYYSWLLNLTIWVTVYIYDLFASL